MQKVGMTRRCHLSMFTTKQTKRANAGDQKAAAVEEGWDPGDRMGAEENRVLKKALENHADMLNVLLPRLGEDEDVVDVNENKLI